MTAPTRRTVLGALAGIPFVGWLLASRTTHAPAWVLRKARVRKLQSFRNELVVAGRRAGKENLLMQEVLYNGVWLDSDGVERLLSDPGAPKWIRS